MSSFGFGGVNAHVIIKGAASSVRKEIRPLEIPFDRQRASSLEPYVRLEEQNTLRGGVDSEKKNKEMENGVAREDIDNRVRELFFQLTNIEEIDPEIELTSQGLDSMNAAELLSQLREDYLKIEIGPEILFEYPLRDQFVDQVYALAAGANGISMNAITKAEAYENN